MSTRQGGNADSLFGFNLGFSVGDDEQRVIASRLRFFDQLGLNIKDVAYQKQIHETTIALVNEGGENSLSDALVTKTPMVGLSITAADCVPVLVYAPGDNTIAAVHAGWRGSVQRITWKTLIYLRDELHVDLQNTFVFIAPSAGGCCYEVSEDTASQFPEESVTLSSKNTTLLDLKEVNRLQLLDAGIPEENIEVSSYCTICKPSIFHSYRRDGEFSGRMLAVIAMKETL